jgi:hypothetical protein
VWCSLFLCGCVHLGLKAQSSARALMLPIELAE